MFNVFFPSVWQSSLAYYQPGLGSFRCIHCSDMVYRHDEVVAIKNYENSLSCLLLRELKLLQNQCTLTIPSITYKQTDVLANGASGLFHLMTSLICDELFVVFHYIDSTLIKKIPKRYRSFFAFGCCFNRLCRHGYDRSSYMRQGIRRIQR